MPNLQPFIESINEPGMSRQSLTPVSINEPPIMPEIEGGPPKPKLSQIQPFSAVIGAADVTMQCIGSNFTPAAFITFNGGQENTVWQSKTKVTTIVKPSTATTPGVYPVTVVTQFGESETLTFEFLAEGTKMKTEAVDPDDLEEEIEAAEEEGDFKPTHRTLPKRRR